MPQDIFGQMKEAAAVAYVVDGPHTPAGICRKETKLIGICSADYGGEPTFEPGIAAVKKKLASFKDRWRVYDDIGFSLALEAANGLSYRDKYLGMATLKYVLQESATAKTDCKGFDYESSIRASLDCVRRVQDTFPSLLAKQHARDPNQTWLEIEGRMPMKAALMTVHGVHVNPAVLADIVRHASFEAEKAEAQVQYFVGRKVDLRSTDELGRLLSEGHHLPVIKTTSDGEPSIRLGPQGCIHDVHPVVRAVRRFQDQMALVESGMALLREITARGVVHPEIDFHATFDGEITCNRPPLPSLDPRLRVAIEPAPGFVLLQADYLQQDFRLLAGLSQDQKMLADFKRGSDIDRMTAARIFGVPQRQISLAQLDIGKRANMGILNGQTPGELAKSCDIPLGKAVDLISQFEADYPRAAAWLAELEPGDTAREAQTFLRARVVLPKANLGESGGARKVRHQAARTLIRRNALDLVKLAIYYGPWFEQVEAHPLLPLHDGILLEVPKEHVAAVKKAVRTTMEKPIGEFGVPVKVEIRSGKTWAECGPKSA